MPLRIENHRRAWSAFAVAVLAWSASLDAEGCGSATDQQPSQTHARIVTPPTGIGHCLAAAGARFARSSQEISFYLNALHNNDASKPGVTWDKTAKLEITEWRSVDLNGQPRTWTLWDGQPFVAKPLSVKGVIRRSDNPHYYVAYAYKPTTERLRALYRCFSMTS